MAALEEGFCPAETSPPHCFMALCALGLVRVVVSEVRPSADVQLPKALKGGCCSQACPFPLLPPTLQKGVLSDCPGMRTSAQLLRGPWAGCLAGPATRTSLQSGGTPRAPNSSRCPSGPSEAEEKILPCSLARNPRRSRNCPYTSVSGEGPCSFWVGTKGLANGCVWATHCTCPPPHTHTVFPSCSIHGALLFPRVGLRRPPGHGSYQQTGRD